MNLKTTATALAIITGLSLGGLELEKNSQIANIHKKNGINTEIVLAIMSISEQHKKDVENALIEEFEKNGEVDSDNFPLHQTMINNHFKELQEADNLPDWYNNNIKLTQEEKIENIHTSIKSK